MYAEYVPVFASPEGVIRGPAGEGRAAFVSRDDVADVAAAVLASPDGHDGRTYDVTGPEALSLDDAAAVLARAAGREVVYERETLEQARESRRPSGAPDWEIEGWVTSYAALAAGDLEPPSDTVQPDPGPPAALARRRAARAPREHGPPDPVRRIEAANDAGYAAPIGLAADPVVFTLLDGRLSVLLARRLEEPQRGMFALPGGFVGAEESPEQTAERKLREKTGVGSVHLEQLRTYAEPERDPRGWLPSIAYLALVPPGALPAQTPAERDASWHPLDALPELALDHARIVDDGLWRLRARIADKALVHARRSRPAARGVHAQPGPAALRGDRAARRSIPRTSAAT